MSQESKIIVGFSRDELKKMNYNPVTLEKQPDETVQQNQEQNGVQKPAVPIANITQAPTYPNTFQTDSRTQFTPNPQYQNFQQSKTFQQQTPQFQNNVQHQNFINQNSQQKFQSQNFGYQNQQFGQQSGQFQPQPQGFQSGYKYKDNFYPK